MTNIHDIARELTDAEHELREWLITQPNGGKWWLITKGAMRRSYEQGQDDCPTCVERKAIKAEFAAFQVPMHDCPGCGEVKFVGHGPLCPDCYEKAAAKGANQ